MRGLPAVVSFISQDNRAGHQIIQLSRVTNLHSDAQLLLSVYNSLTKLLDKQQCSWYTIGKSIDIICAESLKLGMIRKLYIDSNIVTALTGNTYTQCFMLHSAAPQLLCYCSISGKYFILCKYGNTMTW